MIFVFQENARAEFRVEQQVMHQWRRLQRAIDNLTRRANVLQRNIFGGNQELLLLEEKSLLGVTSTMAFLVTIFQPNRC